MRFLAISLVASFVFLISCSKKKEETAGTEEVKYSKEVAEVIKYITSGTITPNASIEIRFVNDAIDEGDLESKISNPFQFDPSIDGEARWKSRNTLVFTPSVPWQPRTNYSGRLHLSKLLPNADISEVPFKFYIEGVELVSLDADLRLLNPADPKELIYEGKLEFSQPVNFETLKKSSSLEGSSLNWNQESSKVFSFSSQPLERGSSEKKYQFRIDKDKLNLPASEVRNVVIVPLKGLKVTLLEKDESGRKPKLVVSFSDQLDQNQSIDGFVKIDPEIPFTTQKLGKNILIDGDFKFGETYRVMISEGVKSRWANKSQETFSQSVTFSNVHPQVEFGSKGLFMPTSNNKNLQFLTVNLQRVHVEVKRVFDANFYDFFKEESLKSSKDRHSEFRNTYISTIGAIVYSQTLEIGSRKNEWLLHDLSLSNALEKYSNGLFLIRINFTPEDLLVSPTDHTLSYIQASGQVYKPVTISDIGLLAKQENENTYHVYATNIITGKPMQGVNVKLRRYDDIHRAITDAEGKAVIRGKSYFQLITGEKDGQISVIKEREMEWNKSGFDVGGLNAYDRKMRAFIYTERGVYRPGDSVNVSCIVRHKGQQSGTSAPAVMKLYNPSGTRILEQTVKNAYDGFYHFAFATEDNAPTGNWNVNIQIGNKYFYHDLKIETVVPNKLKVKVTPDRKTLLPTDRQLPFDVEGRYLFGASADGLPYEAEVEIFDIRRPFTKYTAYSFFDSNVDFLDIRTKIQTGKLDASGKTQITWNVPNLRQAPSPLKVKLLASVQEEGGRPNEAWSYLDLHPFTHYVGIQDDYSYTKLNERKDIPIVVVDHMGEGTAGRNLVYRIYRNNKYWWYQYDSYRDYKLRFKTDKHSFLVEEGTLQASLPYTTLPFMPSQSGQYLIEVQDVTDGSGHTTSTFMSAYRYGGIPSSDENAGTLTLRSDKSNYEVGEEAVITFPSPRQGNILLTVEQGQDILTDQWIAPKDEEDMVVKLKISKSMAPNAYVTVTVLQSHNQTSNDRPIRMFGILPITVTDPASKQDLVIDMPDELQPKQDFFVKVRTTNGDRTQLTLAVVDEGLLDITAFKTPEPWKFFNAKINLGVETYDLFGQVIGANQGDVFKTFSIGGDGDYRESQLDPFEKKKRFKPVSMFSGPLLTDSEGKATFKFTMPNYVGSVRVMAVSAKGKVFGHAEKTVPVKSDLIIQPTIPRALKPGDEFSIPVNVFATRENLGLVKINIETDGPIEVVSKAMHSHTFSAVDDQLFSYQLRVLPAVGPASIRITGSGQNISSLYETDINIVPAASRVYQKAEQEIKPGSSVQLEIPKLGLDGTNNARLQLAVFPNMDFMHRLDYLIRYPYGCIEQTTSSVYPQLALKSLFKGEKQQQEIDHNVNAGIDRLSLFQTSDGGFSYWPGGQQASEWGSNYAGQFLIEARRKGYAVPNTMYDGIIRYLERQSRRTRSEQHYLMMRVNRCYVLAQAGKAPLSEMNLIRQNEYNKLKNVQKWQLIAAYKLAGAFDKVKDLIPGIKVEADEYQEFAHTYGSRHRDLGLILRCLVLLERPDDAELLAKTLAKTLSSNNWYSTQTVGQMLLGMGEYFEMAGISAAKDLIIEGQVTLPDGTTTDIRAVDNYQMYIGSGYSEKLTLALDGGVQANKLYATISANGVPLKDSSTESNQNIQLDVQWYNEDGDRIDVSSVQQGTSFYGRFTAFNGSVVPYIEEVALVQILPSGWEIENTRLSSAVMPAWMEGWNTGSEEYLDIRDDRIMWFFDLRKAKLDFVIKVNAITAGTYEMPGARCEAMYNRDYMATKAGKSVTVTKAN